MTATRESLKGIGNILPIVLSLLIAACGGGGGGDATPGPSGPPIYSGIMNCAGSGATGTLIATVLAPNTTTNIPIAAADVTIQGNGCTGKTGTLGTIQFQNVPTGVYTLSVQKGFISLTQPGVTVSATPTTITLRFSATALHAAVVPGRYDAVEVVLDRLGFSRTLITKADLNNAALLSGYNMIFLNCGMDQPLDLTIPESSVSRSLDVAWATTIAANLQNFVAAGKHLYASDWAYVYVEKAFPAAIDFFGDDTNFGVTVCDETQARIGDSGTYSASILDSSLATALGRTTMSVNFDFDDWVVLGRLDTQGAGTTNLISGDVVACGTSRGTRPLQVVFPHGTTTPGKVIYTSFHTQAQATSDMDRILEDLILQ